VPPRPIRQLRNLTRYRKTQIEERSRDVNRLHKASEDAGIKLDCVAADIMGKSGRSSGPVRGRSATVTWPQAGPPGGCPTLTAEVIDRALCGWQLGVMNTNAHNPWNALPALLAGAVMVVLDFFIVNVALPSIATELHAGASSLIWVVAGYGVGFGAFLILSGRAGDKFGRRRVYVTGLTLFTLASAACGFAPSSALLIAARCIQGAAGAIVMPQVLAIIGVSFRGDAYARALSIYGMALGLAAIGGQVVGGALVQGDVAGLGWRACFLINVPIGIAALAAAPRVIPESRVAGAGRLDLGGAALLAAALVAILIPLVEGQSHGWPVWTWVSFFVADVILTAFVVYQRRVKRNGGDALVDLALLRERAVSAGLVAQLALASAQASFFVYLALYLQDGRGLGPLSAGLVFTAVAIGYVVASGPAPALVERHGRAVVAAGGIGLAAGLGALAVVVAVAGVGGSVFSLIPGLLLAGVGIGLSYTPITSMIMRSVAPAHGGAASGIVATTQQVGYALGVAVTGVIYFAHASRDVGQAFALSLVELAALGAVLFAATRLLPGPRREPSRQAAPATLPA
jgi:EmrB/QacA subfamily drug resistance transporter